MSDFDWEEYLTFANALFDHQQSMGVSIDAVHRNAISRAYYAAHNRAREWYGKQQDPTTPLHRLPGHNELIEALRQTGKTGATITDCLNDLKAWRHTADYVARAPTLTRQTHSLLKKAQKVFALAKEN